MPRSPPMSARPISSFTRTRGTPELACAEDWFGRSPADFSVNPWTRRTLVEVRARLTAVRERYREGS